jgi:methylphosphotriester-DNA--protein-cysteine methyltransferase
MQLAVLCDFVRRRLALDRVSLHADAQAAIAMLARSAGTERIENICRSIGVSRKHLRHLFHAHVGLTPKTYARMLRFRRIVDFIQSRPPRLDWARLAMSCGYYDQPHFNREFREFAGMTPEEFAGAGSLDGLTMLIDG